MFRKTSHYRFLLFSIFLGLSIIVSLVRQPQTPTQSSSLLQSQSITALRSPTILVLELTSAIIFQPAGSQYLPGATRWTVQVDQAREATNVKGLLIRMNSPGGSVSATQELFAAIKRFRESGKPIIVSIGDICASGGYYVSLPANKIVAHQGSLVGSIGVRISTSNVTELMKKIGISSSNIKSVPYKDILSPTREMSLAEREHIQAIVDTMHKQFVAEVITWRGEHSTAQTLKAAANGLIYASEEALTYGLIDEIGSFHDAKMLMAETVNIDYDELVFRSSNSPLSWLQENFLPNLQALTSISSWLRKLELTQGKTLLSY